PFLTAVSRCGMNGSKAVSVFIDNSFSMSALSQDVPLLEKAKQQARDIVNAFNVDDEFQILTHDLERRHQRLVSKEDALNLIEEVEISPAVKDLSTVHARQRQALGQSKLIDKQSYMLSDFQKSITQFEAADFADTSLQTTLIPLQSVQQRNLAIDSAWFVAPVQMLNQTNTLIVKVRNYSKEDVEDVRLNLTIDGQVRPEGILKIPAGAVAYDTVNVTILKTGWHEASLQITDYPVQFDDQYLFAFEVAESVNVLELYNQRPNPYIEAAFLNDDYFNHQALAFSQIDYSRFKDMQLIILNELTTISSGLASELKEYTKRGGNVLVFPAANSNVNSYNNMLRQFQANELQLFDKEEAEVSYVNTKEFLFADVFENARANLKLPITTGRFKLTKYGNRNEEVILRYRNGETYFGKYALEAGNLFLSAAPLATEFNQLVRNGEIFIPILFKTALSGNKGKKIAYIIGEDEFLETETNRTDAEIVYKLKGNQEEFIPEQRNVGPRTVLSLNNQLKTADFYELFLESDEVLEDYAFNYNRKESALEYFSENELEATISGNFELLSGAIGANLTELIDQRSRGIVLWKWCIWLCLLFLLLEVV
ncbi:MAG: hypothetical protein AAFV80_22175, partial [Bacteroidota bacterium]